MEALHPEVTSLPGRPGQYADEPNRDGATDPMAEYLTTALNPLEASLRPAALPGWAFKFSPVENLLSRSERHTSPPGPAIGSKIHRKYTLHGLFNATYFSLHIECYAVVRGITFSLTCPPRLNVPTLNATDCGVCRCWAKHLTYINNNTVPSSALCPNFGQSCSSHKNGCARPKADHQIPAVSAPKSMDGICAPNM